MAGKLTPIKMPKIATPITPAPMPNVQTKALNKLCNEIDKTDIHIVQVTFNATRLFSLSHATE